MTVIALATQTLGGDALCHLVLIDSDRTSPKQLGEVRSLFEFNFSEGFRGVRSPSHTTKTLFDSHTHS